MSRVVVRAHTTFVTLTGGTLWQRRLSIPGVRKDMVYSRKALFIAGAAAHM